MAFPFAAVIPAAVGAISSAYGAHQANKAAKASSREQMAFQERSYKHRYQWQMEDMRAAGLNPMLAYSNSAPGALSGTSYRPQNELSDMPSAVTSGLQATRLQQELKNLKASTENTKMDTYVKDAQVGVTHNRNIQAGLENEILRQNLHSARATAEQARQTNRFFNTRTGRAVKILDLIGRGLNPFASASSSAKSTLRR